MKMRKGILVMLIAICMFVMTACAAKDLTNNVVSKDDMKQIMMDGISYSNLDLKDVDKENKSAKLVVSYPDIVSIVKNNPLLLADKTKLKQEMAKKENLKSEEIDVKVVEQDGKWTIDASVDQDALIGKIVDEMISKALESK